MKTVFYKAIQGRRSLFGLSKASPISDERLQEVIELAVINAPCALIHKRVASSYYERAA